jgi:hypothetical protein
VANLSEILYGGWHRVTPAPGRRSRPVLARAAAALLRPRAA